MYATATDLVNFDATPPGALPEGWITGVTGNNVSLYYTEGGSRKTIKYVDAPVARDAWHTLRVEFSGRRMKVTLDGVSRLELDDAHIAGTGAVGVWTKADSVTLFDDFSYGQAAAK